MRGVFGLEVDGVNHTLTVTPHLPADWAKAEVNRLRVGDAVVNLSYKREGLAMVVRIEQVSGTPVHFAGTSAETLRAPLPVVEVAIGHGLPLPGARTAQMKVLNETADAHSLRLELEGMAGSESVLEVRRNGANAHVQVDGAELISDTLHVHFPAGTGYVPQSVTLHW